MPADSYRCERKFLISDVDRETVISIVKRNPSMFSEIYHDRYVNNIYFDSEGRQNYFDNTNGTLNRTKFRIRWYGEFLGEIENPVLEIKIKKALLGKKKKYALHPFRMEPGLDSRLLATLFNQSHLPDDIAFELKMQEPCLVNRYRRKYYQRADGRYRITVDDKLQFCAIGLHHNYFMNRVYDRGRVILELKYEEKYDNNSQWITNHFPFRMTRMSKYVRGIDLLNR